MNRLFFTPLALFLPAMAAVASPPPFSAMAPGAVAPPWEITELRERRPAEFSIVDLGGESVLQGEADNAAAGLTYVYTQPETDAVYISWRWKISNHIRGSDMRSREGDDFPARVYLTFDRDLRELPFLTRIKIRLARMIYAREVPPAAICYVWDRELPVGTIMANAYTDTVMMIVAQSGGESPFDWQRVSRDFKADYRAAFASDAPALTSVVVGIDTDNTGESARSWFGDIFVGRVPFAASYAASRP